MSRLTRFALVFVVLAASCGGAHLGSGHGKRTRRAFDAQAEGRDAEAPEGLDASDAKRVLARHRGQKPGDSGGDGTASAGGAGASLMSPTLGGEGGGVGSLGANGPIRLEAK